MTTKQFITSVLGLALLAGAASAQPADPQAAPPNQAAALHPVELSDDTSDKEAAPAQVGEDAQAVAPLAPMPLFAEARNLALPQAVEGWATSVRPILLDEAALLRFGIGTQFVLDLEPGVSFVSSVERVDRTDERRLTLGGTVQGTPDGTFAFAVYDDAVAMVVRVPSQQRLYRLQFMGGGAYWVSRINENLLPECSGARAAPPEPPRVLDPDDDDYIPSGGEPGYGVMVGGGCTAGTPIFDTMVVYTPAARTAAGSHAAIRAEAALAIDDTNVAYTNSLITARARLVYCSEVTYTESGDNEVDLNRFSGTSDGYMDGVHATRDTVNADLVALFNSNGGGIAWCRAEYGGAFSVTHWSSAAPSHVHAHETGHNLGCAHDRQN
ncbi:MAG: reprolysin-like metallopeptidase, partial [Planctomycetota bacterium]